MKVSSIVNALTDINIFIIVMKRRFPRFFGFLKEKTLSIKLIRNILIKKGFYHGALVDAEEINNVLTKKEKEIYNFFK